MRLHLSLSAFLAVTLIASVAQAKEPHHYRSGKLVKMESVKCGTDAKDGKSLAEVMPELTARLFYLADPRH